MLAYSIISAFDDIPYNLTIFKNKNNDKVINYFSKNAKYKNDSDIDSNDKLLLLSTCSTTSTEERMVLLTKIVNYREYVVEPDESE